MWIPAITVMARQMTRESPTCMAKALWLLPVHGRKTVSETYLLLNMGSSCATPHLPRSCVAKWYNDIAFAWREPYHWCASYTYTCLYSKSLDCCKSTVGTRSVTLMKYCYRSFPNNQSDGKVPEKPVNRLLRTRKIGTQISPMRNLNIDFNIDTVHSLGSCRNHCSCMLPSNIPEIVVHADKITNKTTPTTSHHTDEDNNYHNKDC